MEILTFTTSGVETKFTSRGGVSRWSSLRPRLREVVMIRFELGCEPPRLVNSGLGHQRSKTVFRDFALHPGRSRAAGHFVLFLGIGIAWSSARLRRLH